MGMMPLNIGVAMGKTIPTHSTGVAVSLSVSVVCSFSMVAAWRWLRRVSVDAFPRRLSVVIGVLAGIDYLPVLIASMPSTSSQVSTICRCRLFRPGLSRIARIASRRRARRTCRIMAASRH